VTTNASHVNMLITHHRVWMIRSIRAQIYTVVGFILVTPLYSSNLIRVFGYDRPYTLCRPQPTLTFSLCIAELRAANGARRIYIVIPEVHLHSGEEISLANANKIPLLPP
jgi:hypothetical protein